MALVTVIIPMYNKGELIVRAIRSIQHQTYTDFKVIIVDDGSTDNGADVVGGIEDDRIRLIQQENAGPGAARNTGINAADTEYVAFLDADDEWYPWFLENSINAIKEYDVPLVSSMYYRLPDNADMTKLAAKNGVFAGKYQLTGNENAAWANTFISCFQPFNTVAKKEVLQRYGGFYQKGCCVFGEDQYMFLKIASGESMAVITPTAVRYHAEDSQLGTVDEKRPLQPYLANPAEILNPCPAEKKQLMTAILELRAIKTATHMLQRGEKQSAAKLIKNFPGAIQHTKQYHSLMRKFGLGPAYPVYLKIKKNIITPAKSLLISFKNKQKPTIPLMPYEQDYDENK